MLRTDFYLRLKAYTYRGACFAGFVMITNSNANEVQLLDILGNSSVYIFASQDCSQVYLHMCLSADILEYEKQFYVTHAYNLLYPELISILNSS